MRESALIRKRYKTPTGRCSEHDKDFKLDGLFRAATI